MKNFFRLFIEALKGAPRDYTKGSISRAVILLGIPMIFEMVMESVFAVTDIFFAGRLGPYAVATIGLTESMLTLVYTLAMGLGIGAMALVARRVGEHDPEAASLAAVQAVALGVIISILLAFFGTTYASQVLAMMGGSPEIIERGTSYMQVMFAGNVVIILLFLSNAIFRGAGDGTIAMRALVLSNIVNLGLAPCLIFGLLFFPKLGVTGAAVATTVSRGLGAIYSLSHLFLGIGKVKVLKRHLFLSTATMVKILRLSASGTIQIFIGTASWIGMVRVVSGFGSEAVAGYTIGIRVMLFALFPAFGLSNAAATMVGQALGAKKPERAEKAVWTAGFYNLCFLGVMGILFMVFASPIVAWFSTDLAVHRYATMCLTTVSYGFVFYAYGMVLTQSFNGAGDTWTPTYINLFVFWIFEIPIAYLLAYNMKLGPSGVFIAVTLAFSLLAVLSAFIFRRGKWKTKNI